jgi:hypothetical protein
MRHLLLTVVGVVSCAVVSCANDDNDRWSHIEQLLKNGTGQGAPELVEYLKSLTKDQTLTALRQYANVVERRMPIETWQDAEPNVAFIMLCYAEPLRFSNEEFGKLPDKARKDLQAGLLRGPLSDEAFDKMVAGIADRKEGAFFRYALASYAAFKEGTGPSLRKPQKEQLFDTYLVVVSDQRSPEVVRGKCCHSAMRVVEREWWRIIYADDLVKELMSTGAPERRHNVNELLNSGEMKPTATTTGELAPWRQKIQDFRKILVALLANEREPKSLKERANLTNSSLDRLPLVSTAVPSSEYSK